MCAQQRLRSAWPSAQSDQSLRCPHEESLGPQLPTERTAKTLIRLGSWFCHEAAHLPFLSILFSDLFRHPAVKPASLPDLSEISDKLGLQCTEDELKEFKGIGSRYRLSLIRFFVDYKTAIKMAKH